MRRLPVVSGLFSLVLVCGGFTSAGGDPVQDRIVQPRLSHEVSVSLKLIRVRVVGPDGKPAYGLKKEDFLLTDNKEPKRITEFEAPRPPVAAAAARAVSAAGLPAAAGDARVAASPGRKFYLLIDLERNDLRGVGKSRDAAIRFVETQAQAADEIAVLYYVFPTGIVMIQNLTTDRALAVTALRKVRDVPGRRISLYGQEVFLPFSGSEGSMQEMVAADLERADSLGARQVVLDYSTKMSHLAKALAQIPGTKNVLFFSEGISRSRLYNDPMIKAGYEAVAREFGQADSPIYAVNSETLDNDGSGRGQGGEDSLELLSGISGGKAFSRPGVIEDIGKVGAELQDLTRDSYVLGFPIRESWDGSFHAVQVRTRQPGYTVYAQAGYFAAKPFAKMSRQEKTAQLISLASGGAVDYLLPLSVPLRAMDVGRDGRPSLLLLAELPAETLKAGASAKREFSFFVFNKAKDVVLFRQAEIALGRWPAGRIPFLYAVDGIAAGGYECRLVIRDLESGTSTVAMCPAEVAAAAPKRGAFVAPIFFRSGTDAAFVHLTGDDGERGPRLPSLTDIFPIALSQAAPLLGEIDGNGGKVMAVVWGDAAPSGSADPRASAWMSEGATGVRRPVAVRLVSSKQQASRRISIFELEIPPPDAGSWRLTLELAGGPGGGSSPTSREFRVR